jgi:hypothetical protein
MTDRVELVKNRMLSVLRVSASLTSQASRCFVAEIPSHYFSAREDLSAPSYFDRSSIGKTSLGATLPRESHTIACFSRSSSSSFHCEALY